MNELTATLNAERAVDHRRPRRDRAGDRGAGRPARRAGRDADLAGPARRGRHPGDPGQQEGHHRVAEHLQPVVSKLHAAGDKLAPGLNLLVSFPFPKEASEIVKGDYANTSIRAEISLDNFLTGGGGELRRSSRRSTSRTRSQVLNDVQKCLQSGNISSKACKKVLADLDLLQEAQEAVQEEEEQEQRGLPGHQPAARHPGLAGAARRPRPADPRRRPRRSLRVLARQRRTVRVARHHEPSTGVRA